jgi:hypothetical protein
MNYIIYNSFNIKYKTEIRKHINTITVRVKNVKINTVKFTSKRKDILTAGQNKLRTNNSEIFYKFNIKW